MRNLVDSRIPVKSSLLYLSNKNTHPSLCTLPLPFARTEQLRQLFFTIAAGSSRALHGFPHSDDTEFFRRLNVIILICFLLFFQSNHKFEVSAGTFTRAAHAIVLTLCPHSEDTEFFRSLYGSTLMGFRTVMILNFLDVLM